MAKFKTVITTVGAAKIAAVLAGTGSIVLDGNARMAVGDGNGTLPTPVPSQTALVHEVHRAALNSASIDARDPKNIIAELVIPPEIGGFWMREMALYDAAGTLLAVGNMAETYKPSLSEGAGRKQVIRMVIAVSDVSAVTITMDASTVMATKEYVDESIDKHEKSRKHPDATLTEKGFTQLNSDTNSASETQAATPKAVKTVMDATNLKAPLNSPTLTGIPQAPTAPPGTNNQQLANTAFVRAAITALINASPGLLDTLGELAAALGNDANFAATMTAALAAKAPLASPALSGLPTAPTAAPGTSTLQLANTAFVMTAVASLVNSSPAALDTLKELADALGNDANFATTMTNALAGKQPKDTTLTNISGKDVAGLLQYLGIDDAIHGDWADIAGFLSGDKTKPYIRHSGDKSDIPLQLQNSVLDELSGKTKAQLRAYLELQSAAQRSVGTGTNQIPDMGSFASSFGVNGYIKLPGGLIIQWGRVNIPAGGVFVNYPIAFPSLTYVVLPGSVGATATNITANNYQNNGFSFNASAATIVEQAWVAIGR